MARRRRWEEELEEREPRVKPQLAQLDEGKRAAVLEELQRGGGNRAFQQLVGGQALQREAAAATAPAPRITQPFMKITTSPRTATSYAGDKTTTIAIPSEPIKGPSAVKGHEGEFELVENYELEAKSPRDKASGQATGKSQYSELKVVVRKSVGVTRLRHAFMNNEQLDIVIMSPIEDGVETMTLTKAAVVGVKDLANGNVELRFVFEKVRWGAGEMETADDWKKSPA
jgi:type VI protein secretion system component Hcp